MERPPRREPTLVVTTAAPATAAPSSSGRAVLRIDTETVGDMAGHWCGTRDEETAAAWGARAAAVVAVSSSDSAVERHWHVAAADEAGRSATGSDVARLLAAAAETPSTAVRRLLDAVRPFGDGERLLRLAGLWGDPWVVAVAAGTPATAAAVRQVVSAAESSADVRLVVVVSPTVWDALAPRLDGHTRAVLEDGRVPADPAGRLSELHRRAAAAVAAAKAVPPLGRAAAARSLAEALLFAALEADPATAGLFRLNADGGFAFGPRAAEIDLFSPALRIAVEVDGYFHFQDPAAYRRDRAKDWLMQRHGMLVLRFLADDVTDDPAAVVARVVEAVRLRRDGGAPGAHPGLLRDGRPGTG